MYQPELGGDERFMAQALTLAAQGINTTHPNPRVGCVVVKNGVIVGKGWHRFAGEDHAEIIALKQAGKLARGATMYVTLEPCSHQGRTPPCVNMVIKSGISRAVIAVEDPNPLVNRAGISAMQRAGIDITLGIGKQPARRLNRGFFKRILTGMPWVTLKIAVSLDGKTAMASGESHWITAEAARRDAHKLRASSSAILTGVGTVLRDDPKMTARLVGIKRQPLRVILDSNLSTPEASRILQPPGNVLIITVAGNDMDPELLTSDTVEIITCREHAGQIDLNQVMHELAEREINDLMLEAGSRLSGSMLKQGLVDEIVVYMAPDLLGHNARGMFNIPGLASMADRHQLAFRDVRMVGRDLRLSLDFIDPEPSQTHPD